MSENVILDLTAKLQDRAAGEVTKALQQVVEDSLTEAFQHLAEAHGQPDEWAARKSDAAIAIVSEIVRPQPVSFVIKLPGELDKAQQEALSAAVEYWAKQHVFRTVKHCVEAFASRLVDLARP